MDRRGLLGVLGATACALFRAESAFATTARALTLAELVGRSTSVLVATSVARQCLWMEIRGSRRIVTHTRIRVEELVTGAEPDGPELIVRTLGGQVGKLGQLVEGEAELALGETGLLFGRRIDASLLTVVAMAQGHYPIKTEARERIVRAASNLPNLIGVADSAVARLSGRSLAEARGLVRAEMK
jgi:hypothetical protein